MARKQDENLKPIKKGELSREEAKRRGAKGGVASGVARREKKTMAQTLELFLSMPLKDGDLADIGSLKSLANAEGKNISVQEGIILRQALLALKGDPRSAAFIRDLMKDSEVKTEDAGVTIIDDFK